MSRRVAREELFKIVFEAELSNEPLDDIYKSYIKRDESLTNTIQLEFIKKYVQGISENNLKIKQELEKNITGWNLERIGNVEKALLKIATYEILVEKTPVEVVVNEVVEIAKKYGEEKSHEFINGVLAKIISNNNQ